MSQRSDTFQGLFGSAAQLSETTLAPFLLAVAMLAGPMSSIAPTTAASSDDGGVGEDIDWVEAWLDDHDEDGDLIDDRAEERAQSLLDEDRSAAPVGVLVTYDHRPDDADVDRLVGQFGAGDDPYVFDLVPTVQAQIPASQVSELGRAPGVVAVQYDFPLERKLDVSAPATQAQPAPGGGGPYEGETAADLGYDGTDSVVAVLDSGIQDQHEAFSDTRWIAGTDVTPEDSPAQSAIDCTNPADDTGHGTHVASTALGNASDGGTPLVGTGPGADLVEIRIAAGGAAVGINGGNLGAEDVTIGSSMRGFEFVHEWNQAIDDGEPLCAGATQDDRIDVATLSFGSFSPAQGDAGSEGEVIEALAENGVAVTIAAGNCGPNGSSDCDVTDDEETVTSPANAAGAIAVANNDDQGSITRANDAVHGSSSRGPVRSSAANAAELKDQFRKPEIAAPGTSITAAGPAPGTQSTLTGTSMAAPHVAGIAATLVEAGREVAPQTGGENLMLPDGTGYAADGSYTPGENPVRDAIVHGAAYDTSGVSADMLDKWESTNAAGLQWNNGYGYGHVNTFDALCWAWDNVLVPGGATPSTDVQEACGLDPAFEVDLGDPVSVEPSESVTLDVHVEGGTSPFTYAWDLDDDGTFDDATGDSTTVSFDETGTYPVAVQVTDDQDRTRSDQTSVFVTEDGAGGGTLQIEEPSEGETVGEQVTVEGIVDSSGNGAPSAAFTTTTEGLTVHFDGTDSTDPDGDSLAYEWSFGDGSPAGSGATVDHTYQAAGTYEACLTVSDGSATDEICQEVTAEAPGPEQILTDPEGDAQTPTSTSNIDEMDITKLEGIQNDDGSFTMILTVNELQEHTVPTEAGGNGASWRVQWDVPGTNGFFVEYQTGLVNTSSPGDTWTSCAHGFFDDAGTARGAGEAPCNIEFGDPAKIHLTYPASAMAENGYDDDELLTGVTASTNAYQGTPKDPGIYAGRTVAVDDTSSGNYQLSATDSRVGEIGGAFSQGPREAPSEPPEDPHIQDEGGDIVGDTVPTSQMDIESGWFDADADHLYVGLEMADIPQDTSATSFIRYSVPFTPTYEVDDPSWGGWVGPEDSFNGLQVNAIYSPAAVDDEGTPTVRDSPVFELQVLFEDAQGIQIRTVTELDHPTIDAESDIVWWPVPREDLQNPPPGSLLTETSAESAPAVDGVIQFRGGDRADGRPYEFPGSSGPQPPTVNLAADPAEGTTPLDVTFQPDTDADDVASWTITYGDGVSESGSGSLPDAFQHVYEDAGTYTATLEVTDADGQTGTGEAQVDAQAPEGRQVRVSADGLDPVTATCEDACANWQASLDLSSLEEGDLTITAELLEDGETTATDSVPVTFSTDQGLVVQAPEDNQRLPPGDVRVQGELEGTDALPTAGLSADPQQGTAPLNVTFGIDASDDDGIASWRLTTGDGTVIDGSNVPAERAHTYEEVDEYQATLTVTDTAGQRDSVSVAIDAKEDNAEPATASSPSPADGATGVGLQSTLTWEASDPDGDDLTYDVYLGEEDPPTTLIAADQPEASLIPSDLEPATTYHWQVVADDGTATTEGPVWTFTTEDPSGLEAQSQTVIAYIDSGINPYNTEFRRADATTHPSGYISQYPEDASASELCFYDEGSDTVDQSLCPTTVGQAAEQDLADGAWGNAFQTSSPADTGPGEGDLAYVPGTNIVGAISFSHDGDADYPTFDDDQKGAGDYHGTNVAGTIAGQTTGSCPDCKIVVIEGDDVDSIRAGYEWAANQPWIDIVTSSTTIGVIGVGSSPAGFISGLQESTYEMVDNGKMVFEASGNGAGNLGLAQTSTLLYHNYNPWTNPVGCAAPETGQPCQYHDSPNPITASGTDRNTAATGSFFGTTNTGGTSFASPSAAGVAGQALLSVRDTLDDTEEGPDPDTKSLVHVDDDTELPEDTALTNGVLTKLELEEAVYKTARRETMPKQPDQLLVGIDELPNSPANLYKETYGDVYRGDWGVDHPDAVDAWSSAGAISSVLLGDEEMPNRYLEEYYWEEVVEPTQTAVFGEHPTEPDDDGWPRDDERSTEGLDGRQPSSTGGVDAADLSLSQATGTPGEQPSPDNDRLFLHHEETGDDTNYWMNTVEQPADDASGYGATGASPSGYSVAYTMANPTLDGDLLLEEDGEIRVHVEASGYAAPTSTPGEIDLTLRAGGTPIAAGTAEREIDADTSVYETSMEPTDQLVTKNLRLEIAWDGPAYSFHTQSQGASWMQLPVATELPDQTFATETRYLDDIADSYELNGDTVPLTPDATELQGDDDLPGTVFPVPQDNGIVVNLEGRQAFTTSDDVLVGDEGSAQVWLCPLGPDLPGGAQVTVSARLQAGDTALGSGSTTQQILHTTESAEAVRVPLDLHNTFVPADEKLTGEIRIQGPGNLAAQNIALCGGSADRPWLVNLATADLGEQVPSLDLATDVTDTLSETVTLEGTYQAPTDPGVDQLTWSATNFDEWNSASPEFQDPPLRMDPRGPGEPNGGEPFPPQPDGLTFELTSEDPVADEGVDLATDGSGTATLWATATGVATDVRVDMTVLLEDASGETRVVAEGAQTKNVAPSLAAPSTVSHEPFRFDFDPAVTEVADDEHLVLRATITNAGEASTSQVNCACGGQERPLQISLPVDASTEPADETVEIDVGTLADQTSVADDGTWTYELDTTQLTDDDHTLTLTPTATYDGDTREGTAETRQVTVDNSGDNAAPEASLDLNETSPTVDTPIEATLEGSDPETDASDLDWSIAWGDGSDTPTGTGLPATVEHTYTEVGTHEATLTVTDADGASAQDTATVHVNPPPAEDEVVVQLDERPNVTATDDSDAGDLSEWHADLANVTEGLHEITVEHVRDRGDERTVVDTDERLLRVAESGVPEVAIDQPEEGNDVHEQTPIDGRVTRYTGEEEPGTTSTSTSSSAVTGPIAGAFTHTVDTVRPAADAPDPVQAQDLASALEHLLEANGEDPSQVSEELEDAEIPEDARPALASLAEATAQATELQQEAVDGASAEDLRWMRQDPVRLAELDVDMVKLAHASALVQATVDEHLDTLEAADPVEEASGPDVALEGVAIDLGGDTEYPEGRSYVLKVDLAGDDVHRDTAGGAFGTVSVSIDVDGSDTYDADVDADETVGPDGTDAIAVQGAGDTGGVGILVDAAGADTYQAAGDLEEAQQAAFVDRLAQGAGGFAGVGVLADLAGEDTYDATLTNTEFVAGDFLAASQAGVHEPSATFPGYSLLLEQGGDDAYASDGFARSQADVNAIVVPSVASLADVDGSDTYDRADNRDYASTTRDRAPSTAHFLDTDDSQPSVHVRDPADGDTVRVTADVAVEARDLDDMLPVEDARSVTQVEAEIGDQGFTNLTQQADSDRWTGTLNLSGEDGPTELTARATNDADGNATDAITVTVNNNQPPTLSVDETIERAGPSQTPAVSLDLSGTDDPDSSSLTYTVAWGDGDQTTKTTGDDLTDVSHAYAEGEYTITVTVEDDTGNADERTLDVDLSPPAFASVTQEDVQVASANYTVDLDDEGTLDASLDGAGTVDVTEQPSAFEVNATELDAATTYTLTLTSADDLGNEARTTETFTTSEPDNEAPTVTLDLDATTVPTGGTVEATVTAEDPEDGGLSQAMITWDDGTQETVALTNGEGQARHTYDERCECTVHAQATDSDGASASDSVDLVVDQAPDVTLTVPDSPAPETEEQTIELSASDGDDDPLDVEILVDGEPATVREADPDDNVTTDGKRFLADIDPTAGTHDVTANVSDRLRATVAEDSFTVNNAPDVSGTVTPFSGSTGETFTYEATTSDVDGEAVDVTLLVDTDTYELGSDRTEERSLDKGQHRFAIEASDGTDTVRWPSEDAWAFGPIVGNVSRVELAETDSFENPVTAETDSGFDEWSSEIGQLSLPEDEASSLFVRGVDEAEGPGPAEQLNVTRDQRPTPTIDVLTDTPVATDETIELAGSAEPSAHGDAIASLDWQFGDGAQATGESPTHAYADDGTFTITLEATDEAGRTGQTTTNVTVLNRAPDADLAHEPETPLTQETVTFTLDASDPDGTVDAREITVFDGTSTDDDVLASASDDRLSLSFPDDGTFLAVGEATDDDGTATESRTEVTVANRAPAADLTVTPTEAFAHRNVTFDATDSSDADGDIVAYAYEPGDDNRTRTDSDRLTHAYTQVDRYEANLTVEDDDGAIDHDGPVTVEVHAFPTVPDQSVAKGRELVFTVETMAPNGSEPASLAMQAPGLPDEASFEDHGDGTGTFEWQTTVDDEGDYEANFTADTGASTATQTVAIDVTAEEPAAVVQETRHGYDTVQAALDDAEANQTVLVRSGEHAEALTIDTRGLTLCPAAPDDAGCDLAATPTLAADSGPGLAIDADDVRVGGFEIQPTGTDTVGLAVGSDEAPVDGFQLAENHIEPEIAGGTAVQLVGDDATLANNTIRAWDTGVDATGTNVTTADNQLDATTTAFRLADATDASLDRDRVRAAETAYEIAGSQDVAIEAGLVSGTTTGIAVTATDAQPADLEVHNTRLGLTATPLRLGSATEAVTVDATCNDWGAYFGPAIEARIDDQGSGNQVDYQPWLGPNPTVTLAQDCLVEPVADFAVDPQTPERGEEVEFTDESRPGSAPIVEWTWEFGDGTTARTPNATHTYDEPGTYRVNLTVRDANGMQSSTTRPIHVPNLAPSVQAPPAVAIDHTESLEFTMGADDGDGDDVQLGADGEPLQNGAEFTVEGQDTPAPEGTFNWTDLAPRDRGTYEVNFTAVDEYGAATRQTTTVTVEDDAPEIDPVPGQATRLEHPVSFDVAASDANGDPVTLAATGVPDNATFEITDQDTASPEASFAWTPTDPDAVGTHDIVLRAEAEGLETEHVVEVEVGEENVPPEITVERESQPVDGNLTAISGEPLELTFRVDDPDGEDIPEPEVAEDPSIDSELTVTDVTTENGENCQAGCNLTAEYDWTPADQTEPVEIEVTAADGFGEVNETLTIEVVHPPDVTARDPIVDGLGQAHAPLLLGEDARLRANVTDLDEDLASVAFDVGDQTIDANRQDGLWIADETVTPTGDELAYTVNATDDGGLATTREVNVDRRENPGPEAAVVDDQVNVTGGVSPVDLDATPSSHPEDRPISVSWTLPADGSGSTDGALAEWIPPEAGVYTATATVTDHLGDSDAVTVEIVVEDAILAQTALPSHPDRDVNTTERPTASVYVVDEVGMPIGGADVNFTVSHEVAGELTQEQRRTADDGVRSILVPFDTDTEPGANVQGGHELEIVMSTESDMDVTPDVIETTSVIPYEVVAPLP